jgi:hypothetical protein
MPGSAHRSISPRPLNQRPGAWKVPVTPTHRGEQQQRVRAVQHHAVDLEQPHSPTELLLGLRELTLMGQLPPERQVHNPAQRLGDEPLRLGDLHCAMGKGRGGAIVVLVAGDQRQHRKRGHHGKRLCGWRHDPDQLLQPRPSLRRVSGQVRAPAFSRYVLNVRLDTAKCSTFWPGLTR